MAKKNTSVDFSDCPAFLALSLQQQTFCLEYLKDFNATQAAIRAKYSKKTAGSKASSLLKIVNIQKAISEASTKILQKPEIASIEEVAEYLTQVKRGNIADVCSWNEDGLKFTKTAEEMPRNVSQLIKKIKTTTRASAKGDWTETETNMELHDPLKAAEMLGRYHGMFKDKMEFSASDDLVNKILEARKRG